MRRLFFSSELLENARRCTTPIRLRKKAPDPETNSKILYSDRAKLPRPCTRSDLDDQVLSEEFHNYLLVESVLSLVNVEGYYKNDFSVRTDLRQPTSFQNSFDSHPSAYTKSAIKPLTYETQYLDPCHVCL